VVGNGLEKETDLLPQIIQARDRLNKTHRVVA
jgi:hypothetical protein